LFELKENYWKSKPLALGLGKPAGKIPLYLRQNKKKRKKKKKRMERRSQCKGLLLNGKANRSLD
jgi:hypothetical protein